MGLVRLKQEYREKHPDVISKQAELDSVKRTMDDMVAEWKDKIEVEKKKLQNRPDVSAARIESDMKKIDGEIKREQGQLEANERQIAELTGRINSVPGAEIALGQLDREYQTKKANYDSLLAQQQKISLSAEATSQHEQALTELSTAIEMYQSMEMTFWLPQVEAALAQVEGR